MDKALIEAQGVALALVAAMLQRGGIVKAEEFGQLLALTAVTTAETDPAQGDILGVWAAIVKDSAARH
ncbi:MAG: hypothetical protein E6Q40_01405 [Cupriavidus sp.]|nr:MAG: hypothetical protein E6Q40_01405 [Cupriavidus sp.]